MEVRYTVMMEIFERDFQIFTYEKVGTGKNWHIYYKLPLKKWHFYNRKGTKNWHEFIINLL